MISLRSIEDIYIVINNFMSIRTLIIILLSSLAINCFASKISQIDEVEKLFGFEVVLDTNFKSIWTSVSYKGVADTARIVNYLELLQKEYSKYPASYFQRINIDKIIICNGLVINSQKRAAIPDPYKNALFLAIDSSYSEKYLIHVMHHELHHCTEFFLYENMYYDSDKWTKFNRRKFNYGNGGQIAYKKDTLKKNNWSSLSHPIKGFVNLYSTLGQEEDRCEIVALIMQDSKREILIEFCKRDRHLRKKIRFIISELNGIIDLPTNYWNINMGHI